MGDTLSNPQLVSALKIARGEVEDAKKNNRGYYAAGTNERLVGAAQQYLSKQDLSIGDQTDFIQAVGQFHNGLATVAMVDAMEGTKGFETLSTTVINNQNINSKNTIAFSKDLMTRANNDLWTIMGAGLTAVDLVVNAGLFPEVGAGPRGPYKYNLENYEVPLLKYDPRVRQRGVEDPSSHNFPYTFDKYILKTQPKLLNNGYKMYQADGYMMGGLKYSVEGPPTQKWLHGVFEIGVTKEGVINHRFFRPF